MAFRIHPHWAAAIITSATAVAVVSCSSIFAGDTKPTAVDMLSLPEARVTEYVASVPAVPTLPDLPSPSEPGVTDSPSPTKEPEPTEQPRPVPTSARPEPKPDPTTEAGWTLKWHPSASSDGLGAFEGLEDDRADSHPGAKHIYVQGDAYRFDMHTRDRDGDDRQRTEAKGMRAGGQVLSMGNGETWRIAYDMYIPSSLKATTAFSHIMQLKMPGPGTGPILVMSLRRHGSVQKIELKIFDANLEIGVVDLEPLQNRWFSTQIDVTIGDKPKGAVRWVVRDGSKTVLDTKKTGVDTWLDDRVRPKWGIYRSLKDSSGSLQDCYLLIRNLRAYQKQ